MLSTLFVCLFGFWNNLKSSTIYYRLFGLFSFQWWYAKGCYCGFYFAIRWRCHSKTSISPTNTKPVNEVSKTLKQSYFRQCCFVIITFAIIIILQFKTRCSFRKDFQNRSITHVTLLNISYAHSSVKTLFLQLCWHCFVGRSFLFTIWSSSKEVLPCNICQVFWNIQTRFLINVEKDNITMVIYEWKTRLFVF